MDTKEQTYNTIEEAIQELQSGRIVMVADDPEREDEANFICAAQYCTPENVNFMMNHG